jgi:hypothetical protein
MGEVDVGRAFGSTPGPATTEKIDGRVFTVRHLSPQS